MLVPSSVFIYLIQQVLSQATLNTEPSLCITRELPSIIVALPPQMDATLTCCGLVALALCSGKLVLEAADKSCCVHCRSAK